MRSKLIYIAVVLYVLLSLAPVAISAPPIQAEGTTWYVDDDGVQYPDPDFNIIQDAINASSLGDTIQVYDGTYNENIVIDKPLTILSNNGSASTIIDGTAGEDNPAVMIMSSNVTFGNISHGFKVTNTFYNNSDPDNPLSGMGIFVLNTDSGELSGITIQGNYIYDIGEGAGGNGPGIALGNMGTGSVQGNYILNNEVFNCSMGIALINSNASVIYDNTISGNTVHLNALPIVLMNMDAGGDIYSNDIMDNEVYDGFFGIMLYGATGDIYENNVSDNTAYDSLVGIGFGNAFGNTSTGNVYDNIAEDNEVYNCSTGIALMMQGDGTVYGNTVQGNNINDSVPGENAIESGISLFNMGYGNVTGNMVDGNTVYNCSIGINTRTVSPEGGGTTGEMSDNVISNNTVYNSQAEAGSRGIEINNTGNADITNTSVYGNTVYNCEGGIWQKNSGSNMENNNISSNTVFNCSNDGILLINEGSGATSNNSVSGNTVYGCDNGIYISKLAGQNTHNDVWNNITWNGTPEVGNSDGISVYACDNISVHGNDISYNSNKGLETIWSDNISVTANNIHNNSEGMYINGTYMSIYNNDIRYNTGSPETGIYINSSDTNTHIRCNNIMGNTVGVGPTSWGVYSDWVGTVDAQYNWWGDSSGPSGNGSGSGDAVSEGVNYSNWLMTELSIDPYGESPACCTPGDLKHDGRINALDLTQCELCILNPGKYPKGNYPGWDANEDGEGPNSGDILAVLYRMLGVWPP